MSRGRLIRATEVTPEAHRELLEKYSELLRHYVTLCENHAELYRRYLRTLDEQVPVVWPPPFPPGSSE